VQPQHHNTNIVKFELFTHAFKRLLHFLTMNDRTHATPTPIHPRPIPTTTPCEAHTYCCPSFSWLRCNTCTYFAKPGKSSPWQSFLTWHALVAVNTAILKSPLNSHTSAMSRNLHHVSPGVCFQV
jgi:hypothetical protein